MSVIDTLSSSRSAESSRRPSGVTASRTACADRDAADDALLFRVDHPHRGGVPVGDVDRGIVGSDRDAERAAADIDPPTTFRADASTTVTALASGLVT